MALDKRSRRRIRKNIENNIDNENIQKDIGYSEKDKIYLIPELCHLTGYTDEMRKDMKLMKTISDITKKNICDKMNDFSKFVKSITESNKVKNLSKLYPISFDTKPELIKVKQIYPGYISMRDNKHLEKKISLTDENLEHQAQTMMYSTPKFSSNDRWMIIYYKNFNNIKNVLETIKKAKDKLGFFLSKPYEIILEE